MKDLIDTSKIQIATGVVGGSQYCCDHEYNLLPNALYCDAIDSMSVHGYMSKASDWEYFISGDASVVETIKSSGTDKYVMIEEWGVSNTSVDDFRTQVNVFNETGVPWLYWQVTPRLGESQAGAPSDCGYDGYEIAVNSFKGDAEAAVRAARASSAIQDWNECVG